MKRIAILLAFGLTVGTANVSPTPVLLTDPGLDGNFDYNYRLALNGHERVDAPTWLFSEGEALPNDAVIHEDGQGRFHVIYGHLRREERDEWKDIDTSGQTKHLDTFVEVLVADPPASSIPEPSSFLLLGSGLIGLLGILKRNRNT